MLFRAVHHIFITNGATEITAVDTGLVVLNFLYISAFSILLGILVGLLCSFMLKRVKNLTESATREASLIIMFGYLSYIIAEMVELSGIMTIFCCGLVIDKYSK